MAMSRQKEYQTEREYQADLIKLLKNMFPGCIVLKNDSSYIQGIPDLTIFFKDRWAMLEVKLTENEPHQPNQDYYVDKSDHMSFGRFIFPGNQQTILDALKGYFLRRS
jgi:hypothetical protein